MTYIQSVKQDKKKQDIEDYSFKNIENNVSNQEIQIKNISLKDKNKDNNDIINNLVNIGYCCGC